ncbi:MAG: TonB-dependent receptor plug domain-containing protein [Flavobacteriaceae bacterium]
MRKGTNQKRIAIFLFFLCFTAVMAAQERISLLQVVQNLEQKHNIRFSYVEEEIAGFQLEAPNEALDLSQSIDYLNNNSPFQFSKINDRYYSISRKETSSNFYCGTLIDSSTGLPLEEASVVLGSGLYATVSNKDGVFYLPRNLPSEGVTISYLGFETMTLNTSELNTNCTELFLFPSISRLNEVLISNVLVKGINRNVNGSTSINTQNFGLLPGQTENDVLQMVQALPGIESANETISTINIRGGANDENLILWEGIHMFQTGHFFGLISAFNPNLTQNVSIYKNGTPSQFGENVSGVIEMASSDAIARKFKGGLGSNLINANAFVEMPLSDKLGIQLSGRSSINTFVETPAYTSFSDKVFQETKITNFGNPNPVSNVITNQEFYFYDYGGKILWDASAQDKFRVNFLAMENHFDLTQRLFSVEETSTLKQKSEAAGASWQRTWNEDFETSLSGSASHYLLDASNEDILTNQTLLQESEVLELTAKLDTRYKISATIQLQSGYHFSEIGIANTQDVNVPRFRNYKKNVLRSQILYSDILYTSPNKGTKINVGARGNYFEKFSTFLIEPRVHLYQELVDGLALELAGEMKSQTTTQTIDLQSDFLGVEKRRWVLANDSTIPIKKSKQASLGILYSKKDWFINLEGFYKLVEGVTSKSQGFQNQYQFVTETGNYTVKGLEVIVNKKLGDFSGWISYSYTLNEYDFENFTPSVFPNNVDITHIATLAGSYRFKNLKFALGLNWRTGKPYTLPLEDPLFLQNSIVTIPYDTPNAERLPDYVRLDFSAEYLWEISKKAELQFNLSLLNVTNADNILNRRFTLEDETSISSKINQIEELSLGFTPNFSVQFLF